MRASRWNSFVSNVPLVRNEMGHALNLDLWLAFVAAYTVISFIPGPSVFMVTGQALSHGLSAAFLCILGDVLGGVLLMTLAFLGAGTILATSALLFQILKWVGVFYIAYLGYRQIAEAYHGSAPEMAGTDQVARPASMRAGFFVGVLNPKAIAFYMAFLTQFMDPGQEPLPQLLILMATSSVVVAVVLSGYALTAAHARKRFQNASARRRFGYAGGTCLIGGSLVMAATR